MLDLTTLPGVYLERYGREKIAEVIGETTSVLAMWEKRKGFPLSAVQRLLEFDPAPLNGITPVYKLPELTKKIMILVPLSGPPEPKMMDSLMYLYDSHVMDYQRFAFNCLSVARNVLAGRFWRSGYPWAFWHDGDSIVPSGNAKWFKAAADLPDMPDTFAQRHAIYNLLGHKQDWGKPDATIVSSCYVGRKKGAPPQFGGGETPVIRNLVKRGPQQRLLDVPWCGFGGVVTHRSVFEDIIRTQGDEIRMKHGGIGDKFQGDEYEFGFFNPLNGEFPTDDVPFCQRARRAGHKIYVDLSVPCAHVGDRAYTYKDL